MLDWFADNPAFSAALIVPFVMSVASILAAIFPNTFTDSRMQKLRQILDILAGNVNNAKPEPKVKKAASSDAGGG